MLWNSLTHLLSCKRPKTASLPVQRFGDRLQMTPPKEVCYGWLKLIMHWFIYLYSMWCRFILTWFRHWRWRAEQTCSYTQACLNRGCRFRTDPGQFKINPVTLAWVWGHVELSCSYGEGGGICGSRGVARPRHRSVRGPGVQTAWPGRQTHGNAGGDLREVRIRTGMKTVRAYPSHFQISWFLTSVTLTCCRKGGFFVDLFVRVSNQVAVNMYKRLGYSVYRTVIEYYSASNGEPDEDAYGKIAAESFYLRKVSNCICSQSESCFLYCLPQLLNSQLMWFAQRRYHSNEQY